MSSGKRRQVELTEQDQKLLLLVARYRLMLTYIAHREIYPERTQHKAWLRLHALEKAGYLNSYPLPTRGIYFTLGRRGVGYTATPAAWTKPLNSQGYKSWMSTLLFCLGEGEPKRTRLQRLELEAWRTGLYCEPLYKAKHYFLDSFQGIERLSVIRPAYERGPFAVARKCRHEFVRHARYPAFLQLMQEGCFHVSVVASSKEQAKEMSKPIQDQLLNVHQSHGVHPLFDVFVPPRIADFLV